MNRSLRLVVVALAFAMAVFIFGAGSAMAQPYAYADSSTAVLTTAGLNDISMCQVPDGSGTPFTFCYERGGRRISAAILVALRDAAGIPVVGVSQTDVRLEEISSPLVWCPDFYYYPLPNHRPNRADRDSDALGNTKFTLSYNGGYHVQGPTYVCVLEATGAWKRIPTPVNVSYNSPDINGIPNAAGDLVVNLADVPLFANDYYAPTYNYRSDFNYDQVINLLDLAIFARAYGKSCP